MQRKSHHLMQLVFFVYRRQWSLTAVWNQGWCTEGVGTHCGVRDDKWQNHINPMINVHEHFATRQPGIISIHYKLDYVVRAVRTRKIKKQNKRSTITSSFPRRGKRERAYGVEVALVQVLERWQRPAKIMHTKKYKASKLITATGHPYNTIKSSQLEEVIQV